MKTERHGATTQPAERPSRRLPEDIRARIPQDLADAIDFHGHLCPGVTIGYRAARIALDELGVGAAVDEELLGVVETDACGVDAFQTLTSCTMGKGNLVYKDYGKQAFSLYRRRDGRGVRVVLKPDGLERDPDLAALRRRVMAGEASEAERSDFARRHLGAAVSLLEADRDAAFTVTPTTIEDHPTARIFDSVTCSVCGEAVMEPRARMRDGVTCCIPCSTRYGRGWEIHR